jgi:hypothetical protein
MRALIRQSKIALLIGLCVMSADSFADTFVFDFSEGDSADVVFESDLQTRDLGIEFSHELPSGTYEIVLDRNNRFIIPVDRGRMRVENDNKEEVSKIELQLPILSLEEGDELITAFHQSFGLSLERFKQWSQPIREYKYPSDFYTTGVGKNYPEISMSVRTSFNKDIPYLIGITFGWNNWFHQSRGTSPESNTLQDFTFDVPKILSSVKPEVVEAPEAERPEPAPEPEKVYEEREPVEAVFDEVEEHEPSEEPVEKSSNWWLWLIGAVVAVGSIALVVRRKS